MTARVLSMSPTFGHAATEPLDLLRSHGCEWELLPRATKMSQSEFIARVAGVDAIIAGVDEQISDEVLEAAVKLKVVAKHGAGLDNIDIPAATRRGIPVFSTAGANSDAVADLTMGLFMALARAIPAADRAVRAGQWPRLVGTQLNGKVLGIVGLGQIGKKVARRATGFGMRILAYDVVQDQAVAQALGLTYAPLDEVLTEADLVSIHTPLSSATRGLIGPSELARMKKGAFLVNVARGGIVDEEALYETLSQKKLGGAALDVFATEPVRESPLLSLDTFIATPHMAGYTHEALRDMGLICAQAIIDVLEGKPPRRAVNWKDLDTSNPSTRRL